MGARCRLCAECSEDVESLLVEIELANKILQLFHIKVVVEDRLPTVICHVCCETVNKLWEYSERVHRAQILLSELNVTTSDSEPPPLVQTKQEMVECVLSDSCAPPDDSSRSACARRPKSSRIKVCISCSDMSVLYAIIGILAISNEM